MLTERQKAQISGFVGDVFFVVWPWFAGYGLAWLSGGMLDYQTVVNVLYTAFVSWIAYRVHRAIKTGRWK